jgi:predicted DsbA family dithiol-disulfide isomerase
MERLFRAYFVEGVDVSDRDALIAIAAAAGMDADIVARLLAEDADTDLVRREDSYAREIGIQGVPCFIIERKYAISGAQDPTVFLQVFDVVEREGNGAAAVN